jgi:hypothetical protein
LDNVGDLLGNPALDDAALEAEGDPLAASEPEGSGVIGEDGERELAVSAPAGPDGDAGEMATEPVVLVGVGDGDRDVGAFAIGIQRDPRLADTGVAIEGEPHVGLLEIGEGVAQLGAQPGCRVEEAVVPRPRRQALVQGDDGVTISVVGSPRRQSPAITQDDATRGCHTTIVTRPVVIVNGPVYLFW